MAIEQTPPNVIDQKSVYDHVCIVRQPFRQHNARPARLTRMPLNVGFTTKKNQGPAREGGDAGFNEFDFSQDS